MVKKMEQKFKKVEKEFKESLKKESKAKDNPEAKGKSKYN